MYYHLMSETLGLEQGDDWVAEDLYRSMFADAVIYVVGEQARLVDGYVDIFIDELNRYTAEKHGQPVALDRLFFANPQTPNSVTSMRLGADMLKGNFLGFAKVESEVFGVGVRIMVDLLPGSSPGIYREELIPLWHHEAQALRWPNFDYTPSTSGAFWHDVLLKMRMFKF